MNLVEVYAQILAIAILSSAAFETATSPAMRDIVLPGGAMPVRRPARERHVRLVPLDGAVRQHIERALNATGGKIYGPAGAAAVLGVPPSTLQSKMKRLGIPAGDRAKQ